MRRTVDPAGCVPVTMCLPGVSRVSRILPGVRHWKRYVAIALALVLVLVVIRVVYNIRHRPQPGGIAMSPGPVLITPAVSPVPTAGPRTLYVIDAPSLINWAHRDPGELMTARAIQGIVNRDQPSIFILVDRQGVHDQDWLNLLKKSYKASVVDKPDSIKRIHDLTWYIQNFRASFAGYVLFDFPSSARGGPSSSVALSLAGVLNAIPIERGDSTLIDAAKAAGLQQLEDVSNRDYSWLKASRYWKLFNREAIHLNRPDNLYLGGDYAVALRMATFWDDVRTDPNMQTMESMLVDQRPGGTVFGWGYTDEQYREDVFVAVASRHNQVVTPLPPNISVYAHYPADHSLPISPRPALPTDTNKHYVAFVYSDGDNPAVVFNELTDPGNDRYASPFRGKVPVGWTLPPSIPLFAGPIVSQIYATASPSDVFVAGPSGYGYAFPSLIPGKQLFAAQTQTTMSSLGLSTILILDMDGSGFSHAALDPLTAQANVNGVFFTAFNGRGQPPFGSVLWSSGKPVLPTVTLQRTSTQSDDFIVDRAVTYLNSLPTDATAASGYSVVYVDFWSISMTDLHRIMTGLNPNLAVVRPDVLAAMARAHIRH
jgi:GxGYxYP putative glycoside hydrolase C-terminal domain/GxGYxYP_N second domain/GxGYxYP_N 1st domain/GxGYxYP third domain